jgi:predicted nucleic acid-binding protein
VDLMDAPFIALTLHLDGRLWTDDTQLKAGYLSKSSRPEPIHCP